MVISRKTNLLLFLIVISLIFISPISLAGLNSWDIHANEIFFRGSGNGPITMHDQSKAEQIQIIAGMVEFTELSILAGSIDFVGLNASENANITALAVGDDIIVFNIEAANGAITETIVKAPAGTFQVDVEGEDSFNYNSTSRLVTIGEVHGLETKQIIVFFNRTQDLTGEWIYYNLTAINVSTGIHDDGFLNSTYFIDGDTYNCSEVVGVPGYVVDFNVTGIDTRAISLWLVNYVYYDGSASHEVNVEVWNFTSSAFVEIGEIPDQMGFEWQNFTVYGLRIPNEFVNSTGALVGRFYHADAGNINHDIFWDRINVLAFIPSEGTIIFPVEFQFFWIVLAIALMLIGIMISKIWFEEGDS